MMYLSSYRMGRHAERLRAPSGSGRAAIICNALDIFSVTRLRNWEREASELAELGYASEELDLRQYFGDADELARRLDSVDLIWAVGGNAFVLARAMTASGFGSVLRPAMERGLIYAGYSAGACVTGPDLRGIELMDDPNELLEAYDASMPARTLELLPFRIVPHWQSDHPESESADRAIEYLQHHSLEYRAIRDGEALIVGDDGQDEVRS